MSDETDDSQKTEDPSQRKLDQAREKGQVVNSKEISNWMLFFAAALAISMLAPKMCRDFVEIFTPFIARPDDMPVDVITLRALLFKVFLETSLAMAFFAVLMVVAAVGSHAMQSGIKFTPSNIQPKWERISLFKGIGRLFSGKNLVEFLKGLAKIAVIGAVLYSLLKPTLLDSSVFIENDINTMGMTIRALTIKILTTVLAILFMIAALDYLYQRLSFIKSLRMSKQEQKEEYKETEGDPVIKNRLRQLRQQRLKKRMMAAVPNASVIITNPTHFAVALKYDKTSVGAPIVLAKGMDFMALKIREVATKHDIPIVENPPLARTLYSSCEVDKEISFDHYKAVAQVISYVMKLKGKKKR